MEIWCECLQNDRRSYNNMGAQTIGRAMKLVDGWSTDGKRFLFGKYGQQRVYYRGGYWGHVERITKGGVNRD